MGNAADFRRQLKAEWRGVLGRYYRVVGAAALTGLRVAVMRTPVQTGTLRNNWQVGTEIPPEGTDNGQRGGRTGTGPSVEQVRGARDAVKRAGSTERGASGLFSTLYLANPIQYATFVENGEGPGQRVAKPMAAPAVAAMNAVFEKNRHLVTGTVNAVTEGEA